MAGLDKGSSTPSVTSSKGENTLMSYFGRINYNYDSRYYVTATMRADGSSKFAKNNRWGYFPSGSLAWAFQREAFMSDVNWLSMVNYVSVMDKQVTTVLVIMNIWLTLLPVMMYINIPGTDSSIKDMY